MSEMSIDEVYAGFETAKVTDNYPKLPPNSKGTVLIELAKTIDGFDAGPTFVIEHKIVKSDDPSCKPGHMYSTTITGLTNKKYGEMKRGMVRKFIAACFGYDHTDDKQQWREILNLVHKKNAAKGRMVDYVTGAVKKGKDSGKEYTPVAFFKHEETEE